MQYNDAQLAAIDAFCGPAMVVAGPGSGKTAVITRRTARLIERGVPPDNILVVTFTKAAAEEMERRFLSMNIRGSGKVTFGTFHSIFFKILCFAYNLNSSNILKTTEAMQILRHLCDFFCVETEGGEETLANIYSEICKVKSFGTEVREYCPITMEPEQFRRVFHAYAKEIKSRQLYDFEDMLLETHRLLFERKDILKQWQEKYQFIMVDEFQDINKLQYETIKLLAGERANLFVVGDDDQSIYGFRGADPVIMKRFSEDYPGARIIKLSVNHRSGKEIVHTAGRLISNNKVRLEKNITAFRKDSMPVIIKKLENQKEEAGFLVDKIKEFHGRGVPYGEMAVLSRSAGGLNSVVRAFSVFDIPFCMKDYFPCLYNHFVAKDIISYTKLAKGLGNREDIARIINKPERYISRNIIRNNDVSLERIEKQLENRGGPLEKIERLKRDLSFISGCTPKAAIIYIQKAIGYEKYLIEYAKAHGRHINELLDVLEQLKEDAEGYTELEEWLNHIRLIEDKVRALREAEKREKREEVTLATMHASKGLEFQVVFIIDVNEGVIPHKKCITKEALEEERRLFYVALTRAKSRLFISSVGKMFGKACDESLFIKEIQNDE